MSARSHYVFFMRASYMGAIGPRLATECRPMGREMIEIIGLSFHFSASTIAGHAPA